MTTLAIPQAIADGPNFDAELIRLPGEKREFWSCGWRVIDFIEGLCILSNGQWTGDPFVLLPWQKRLIYELFEINPETGLRRYRRALIGVGRKNGKTELAAAIGLYFILGDRERSAEVYCAAASEEQADRVFDAAKRMCSADLDAPLAEYVTIPQGRSGDRLTSIADPYSYMKRLTSKGKTKHGLNIHVAILDEVHAWGVGEATELWAALTTGMAARQQPMMLMITTAGTDKEESRCGELYDYGKAVERGDIVDDGFFFRWWEAPEGMDHRDPEYWRIANPSFGFTVREDFYRGELAGTNVNATGQRQGAITEAEFRRLYGNEWIDYGEAPWVTREQIQACRVEPFEMQPELGTWVGVDLSETRDSTAVDHAQWWTGDERPCGHTDEPCLYLKARTWEQPRGANGRPDETWEVPQAEVKQYIRDLNSELRVLTNVFDPWHSKLMRQDLENEGLLCEEIWQTGVRRSGASASLYDLIVQHRLHYCEDTFERHVLNATVRATGVDGGYFLAKRRKGRVMDAAMAAVNVVYGTMYEPDKSGAVEVFWID